MFKFWFDVEKSLLDMVLFLAALFVIMLLLMSFVVWIVMAW